MSPPVHLLLVITTLLIAGVGLMLPGMTPVTIVSVTAALVGVLLYVWPVGFVDDEPGVQQTEWTGGTDVG